MPFTTDGMPRTITKSYHHSSFLSYQYQPRFLLQFKIDSDQKIWSNAEKKKNSLLFLKSDLNKAPIVAQW